MSGNLTPRQILDELVRISRLLDEALLAMRDRGRLLAERERDYRLARAKAWLIAEGTAKQKEDAVNASTANERYARDLADSDRHSAFEAIRNYRQQLSVLQTTANVERDERQLARTGGFAPIEFGAMGGAFMVADRLLQVASAALDRESARLDEELRVLRGDA